MRKHGGPCSRHDTYVGLVAISLPGADRHRLLGATSQV